MQATSAPGARGKAHVGEVPRVDLGLAGVEPEDAHALVPVARLDLAPDVVPRLGVGRVVVVDVGRPLLVGVDKGKEGVDAVVGADQVARRLHLPAVVALDVDAGPHRDHELDAHRLELADHGRRVGPALGVPGPVALARPVEVVDHDDRQRQAAALVLPRHLEQLLLRPVAQLALPEARGVVRQHRRVARGVGVALHDRRGARPGHHEVVDLPRGVGHPAREARPQLDAAHGRVVPQEAIATGRQGEGDRHLGISLLQVDHRALLVEEAVPVLAEAVEALAGVGRQAQLCAGEVALQRLELAAGRVEHRRFRAPVDLFDERLGLALAVKAHAAVVGDARLEAPAAHHRAVAADLDRALGAALGHQRSGHARKVTVGRGAHADHVGAPGLHLQQVALALPDQPGTLLLQHFLLLSDGAREPDIPCVRGVGSRASGIPALSRTTGSRRARRCAAPTRGRRCRPPSSWPPSPRRPAACGPRRWR